VKGVGEKTAVKLIGSTAPSRAVRQPQRDSRQAARDACRRAQARPALARAGRAQPRVPIVFDSRPYRRREPDWLRLRGCGWSSSSAAREGAAAPRRPAATPGRDVLSAPRALADWVAARGRPARRCCYDWRVIRAASAAHRRAPRVPARRGRAGVTLGREASASRSRRCAHLRRPPLVAHDAKPLMRRGSTRARRRPSWTTAPWRLPASTRRGASTSSTSLHGGLRRVSAGAFLSVARTTCARPRARWLARSGTRAEGLDERGPRSRSTRRSSGRWCRAGRDGCPRGIRVIRAARSLRQGARAATRKPHARDLRAGREEFHDPPSPKQLSHILFEKLKLPILRRTKTGPSTDADVLTELGWGTRCRQDPGASQPRQAQGTYADTLPGLVNPDTGRIHTPFNQLVRPRAAVVAGSQPLNIPIRTELGRRIRAASFRPRAGRSSRPTTRRSSCASSPHVGGRPSSIVPPRRGHPTRTASRCSRSTRAR